MEVTLERMLRAIPILQELDKAFIMSGNQPDVYDVMRAGQSSIFLSLGLENKDLMRQGFKEYKQVLAQQQTGMEAIARQYERGLINTQEAMKHFNSLTKDSYLKQFRAGTKAVGNPYYQDMGMTRKDISFIGKARRAEAGFFRKFLHDIKDPLHGAPKGTPGRRPKVHSYQKRAGYYGKSGKAQFFNGMVAGAGDKLTVLWVLGVPQTEHCDRCPVLASRKYTWKTLPTTPRAGDTPCLFNCYCHLEFKPLDKGKSFGGDPDTGKIKFLDLGAPGLDFPSSLPGGITRKDGKKWTRDDWVEKDHNRIRGGMNQARQMIEITKGNELKKWLARRKELNAELFDLTSEFKDLRFLPSHAVGDLVKTIQSAYAKGGYQIQMGALSVGDEVMAIRGIWSNSGVVIRTDVGLMVKLPNGTLMAMDASQDIFFMMSKSKVKPLIQVKPKVPKLKLQDKVQTTFKDAKTTEEAIEFALEHFTKNVDGLGVLSLEQLNGINRALWTSKTLTTWKVEKFGQIVGINSTNYRIMRDRYNISFNSKSYLNAGITRGRADDNQMLYVGSKVDSSFTIKFTKDRIKYLERSIPKLDSYLAQINASPPGTFGYDAIVQARQYKKLLPQFKAELKIMKKILPHQENKTFKYYQEHSGFAFPDAVADKLNAIVSHEMGHVFHNWYSGKVTAMWQKLMATPKMAGKNLNDLIDYLKPTNRSNYAIDFRTRLSEVLAESYSLYINGKWSQLKPELREFWGDFLYVKKSVFNLE